MSEWSEAVNDFQTNVHHRDGGLRHRRRPRFDATHQVDGRFAEIPDSGPMGLFCLHPKTFAGEFGPKGPAYLPEDRCAFDDCVCTCHVEQAP